MDTGVMVKQSHVLWAWGLLVVISLFLTIMFASGCDRRGSDWQTAQQTNTLQAFRQFVARHPDAVQVADAKKGIERLELKEISANWPPRGQDQMPDEIKDAVLVIEVQKDSPLAWEGEMELPGDLPIQGRFSVTGGELTSRLGGLTKKAKFGGWSFIYGGEDKSKIRGWSATLTEGEVIVPNVFISTAPEGAQVENSFEAKSLGEGHNLIHLDPTKGHKLCIKVTLSKQEHNGMMLIGRLISKEKSTVSGVCAVGAGTDKLLSSTASYVGTEVSIDGRNYTRKADGWYVGEHKVHD